MNEFYENKRIIQAHEVDFKNRLRIDSLFMLLQDTAASHADKNNLGYNALIEHNLAWVLSWAKVETDEYPGFGDEIKIMTWPKRKYKLYSLRDFYVRKNEQIISRATSAWLPINLKSKRIIDTSGLPAPIYYQEQESAINEIPQKVIDLDKKEFILTKKMRYTDIDLNQHVNNIRYIELIMDSFTRDKYENSLLKSIEVNFVSESIFNDEIEVYKSCAVANGIDVIEGINKNNLKIIFQARLKWE